MFIVFSPEDQYLTGDPLGRQADTLQKKPAG
jgi:hypothetical protein